MGLALKRAIAILVSLTIVGCCFYLGHSGLANELIDAVKDGNTTRVSSLLTKRPPLNLNDKDANGQTALHWAARGSQKEMVEMLLQAGANADAQDARRQTPLHLAAPVGASTTATVLIRNASVEIQDGEGRTPLHLAVETSKEMIQMLLDFNADLEVVDRDKETPLQRAPSYNATEAVETLRRLGATR